MHKSKVISRFWLLALFFVLEALTVYHYSPLYGAPVEPTPTPDVATVPPLPTPTPTSGPFPIITAQASPSPSGTAQEIIVPTATPKAAAPDTKPASAETQPVPRSEATTQLAPISVLTQTAGLVANQAITGTVTVRLLNMRQAPKPNAALIDTLAAQTVVRILQREPNAEWLYVCCGAQTQQAGWVSAAFIQLSAVRPAPVAPAPTTVSPTPQALSAALVVTIQPRPVFVWQGQMLTLQFVVTNRGNQPLTRVRLRDDLPPELRFMTANVGGEGQVQQEGDAAEGLVFSFQWPVLDAGATVTSTVVVQVAPTTPNGIFIKNLAVVNAQETGDVIGGISIAMPPNAPPQFK